VDATATTVVERKPVVAQVSVVAVVTLV